MSRKYPPLQPWATPSYPTTCRAPSPSSAKGHGAPLGRFPMPLENLIQDLRYGVRMLRRNALFAAAAVITLGLGLGATLAVLMSSTASCYDLSHTGIRAA